MKKTILHTAKDTDFLTVSETAKLLGINTQSVRDHLVRGNFKTYKFKSLTLIDRQEVEDWKKK